MPSDPAPPDRADPPQNWLLLLKARGDNLIEEAHVLIAEHRAALAKLRRTITRWKEFRDTCAVCH